MLRSFRSKSAGVISRAETRDAQRGARTAKIVVLTITGFITGAIWLAIATTVPELVRASGTLIPTGHYQQLQASESGIVTDVLVEEGTQVRKGQVLAVLSSPHFGQFTAGSEAGKKHPGIAPGKHSRDFRYSQHWRGRRCQRC